MKKRIFWSLLLFGIILSGGVTIRPAKAIPPVFNVPGVPLDVINFIETAADTLLTGYDWYDKVSDSIMTPALKAVLIQVVNDGITKEFSSGNNGKPYFVTDWQDYLYRQPSNLANEYVLNNFLSNQLSGGKCKDANYTGSPYYKYLCDQGEAAIRKTGIGTTLPEYTKNPQEDLFAEGNLRALNAYFECGNNPYCTTAETKQTYAQVMQQEKEKAEKEAGSDGVLPKKNTDGTVSAPASIFSSAINDAMLLGNQTIVNAQNPEELMVGIISRMAIEGLQKGFNLGNSSSVNASFAKTQQCNDRCWMQADPDACLKFCMNQ